MNLSAGSMNSSKKKVHKLESKKNVDSSRQSKMSCVSWKPLSICDIQFSNLYNKNRVFLRKSNQKMKVTNNRYVMDIKYYHTDSCEKTWFQNHGASLQLWLHIFVRNYNISIAEFNPQTSLEIGSLYN